MTSPEHVEHVGVVGLRVEIPVSVVMAVRDGLPYLCDSIDSILHQTYWDFEFVIVDDASGDDTARVLAVYAERDTRIRVLRNERNLGMAGSLNVGLQATRGRYIARMDADDIALPFRFEQQVRFLEEHPDVFLVGGSAFLIDPAGHTWGVRRVPCDPDAIRRMLEHRNPMLHPSIMFRNDGRHFYRDKFFVGTDDYDFYFRLTEEGLRLANLPRIVLKYRVWDRPAVCAKHAQYELFRQKAIEFHRQRVTRGRDEYDDFDPCGIMGLDPEAITDAGVLGAYIGVALNRNEFDLARQLVRRYWRCHGVWNRWTAAYATTLLGTRVYGWLRHIRRRMEHPRFVFLLDEWHRARGLPRIGFFLEATGGLARYQSVGSLTREMALYRRLADEGWQVTLYTCDRSRVKPDLGFSAVVRGQWPWVLPCGLNLLYRLAFPLLHLRHGRHTDVLVSNQALGAWPAIVASRLWGARTVARCGWVYGEAAETMGWSGRRVGTTIRTERWTFRHADLAVVPTPELAAWIRDRYGVPSNRIAVIPNYVNTELFTPAGDRATTAEVLSVGRLNSVKRFDLLLESVRGLNVGVTIIGSGSLRGDLTAMASRLAVGLEILDRVDHEALPSYLRGAKVFLMTSCREGHPKALIEAMACGCACVGVDVPGIRNQIRDGETGLVVESNPEAIRKAVQRLLGDRTLRATLGANARAHACREFAFDRVVAMYEGVLTDARGRNPGSRFE